MSSQAPTLGSVHCVWPAAATLGEGACWSVRQQSLYWVDILGQRLYRHTPSTGERRQWQFDETISAVAERADGPIVATGGGVPTIASSLLSTIAASRASTAA